jgi:hypothetical protein
MLALVAVVVKSRAWRYSCATIVMQQFHPLECTPARIMPCHWDSGVEQNPKNKAESVSPIAEGTYSEKGGLEQVGLRRQRKRL